MHLVILASRSDAVFGALLHLAGRRHLILEGVLSETRERVAGILGLLDQLTVSQSGLDDPGRRSNENGVS